MKRVYQVIMNGEVKSRHSSEEQAVKKAKALNRKFNHRTVVEKLAWSELWVFEARLNA